VVRRDKILVVDLEATCWENGHNPPGIPSEIIEIGLCMVTMSDLAISYKRSILVKPVKSWVSEFCTQLTTITPEMANGGIPFEEACEILKAEYNTPDRVWISWGNYDHKMFRAQCESMQVEYPFSDRHLNFKQAYASLLAQRRIGIYRAMKRAGLAWEGTHHRGVDDAFNTARLFVHAINEHGTDFLLPTWY